MERGFLLEFFTSGHLCAANFKSGNSIFIYFCSKQ
jgi:hypothetical protein